MFHVRVYPQGRKRALLIMKFSNNIKQERRPGDPPNETTNPQVGCSSRPGRANVSRPLAVAILFVGDFSAVA
jgi:hypothetical protein